MNTFKHSLVIILLSAITGNLYAQTGKINYLRQWQAGIDIGTILVSGDVTSGNLQLAKGFHVYKPLLKWFGIKFNYLRGKPEGMNWLEAENYAKNGAWSSHYSAPTKLPNGTIVYGTNANGVFTPSTEKEMVYYNYKTTVNSLSLAARFTLPLPYKDPHGGIYLGIGLGELYHNTKVNTMNDGNTYRALFKQVNTSIAATHAGKKDILKALKDGMDNSYETYGETEPNPKRLTRNLNFGAFYTFKKRYSIGLEANWIFTKSDLLDGQRWQEHAYGDAVPTRDFDHVFIDNLSFTVSF